MFGRDTSTFPEDPSVAPAETILDRVATRATPTRRGERPVAGHAWWICACISVEDAPTWLIYDEPNGRLKWSRIPDGSEASGIVDATSMAGGHADPGDVLAWLRGDETDPWAGGDGWWDEAVVSELARKILGR